MKINVGLLFLSTLLIGLFVFVGQSEAQDCTGDFLTNAPLDNGAELSVSCDSDSINISSNGLTSFEFVQTTPNALQSHMYNWEIPLNATWSDITTDLPLLGAVGVAVDGLPLFGPNEAPQADYGDPDLDGLLDYCNGHTAQQGMYHYHAAPTCLFDNYTGNVSLVVGYAFDGYPILAPYTCVDATCTAVREVQSSFQRTSDVRNAWEANEYIAGSGDLDECNGMVDANGNYAYYATNSFPYLLSCYHGEPQMNGNNMDRGMAMNVPQGNPNTQMEQASANNNGQAFGDRPQPSNSDRPPRDGQRPPRGN